jgi:hypothetical protein
LGRSDFTRAVDLGFGHQGLADKLLSYRHVVFQEVGPTRRGCAGTLSRARYWTTDFGVEAGIADAQDVLPEFLEALHCGLRVERGAKLLPELGPLQLMQRSQ